MQLERIIQVSIFFEHFDNIMKVVLHWKYIYNMFFFPFPKLILFPIPFSNSLMFLYVFKILIFIFIYSFEINK